MKSKYRIKTSCPQCGCSGVTNLPPEERLERYGDLPNVELECSECLEKYEATVEVKEDV